MSLIRPFVGLRPRPEYAAEVVAAPYDVLNSDEARSAAAGKPWSFLHLTRPEIDLRAGADPHDPAVYARGAENFTRMLEAGVLRRDDRPCYYCYRLVSRGHVQTGLVAVASVDAYASNRIRRHEFTRPENEDDRARQIEALNAQTSPVFLTYRDDRRVDALLARVVESAAPAIDVTAADGVRHVLWVIDDSATTEQLTRAFEEIPCLYVADGHHRSAAALRVARRRRAADPKHTGEEPYNYFLAVIFPADQLRVLDYNRAVRDLNGLSHGRFLQAVRERFAVETADQPVRPTRPHEFGMYLPGRWYRLTIRDESIPAHDPVRRLDVSLLSERLLAPVLGVVDPRRDPRIQYIGGSRGLEALAARVDAGDAAVAFALFPTRLKDLMAVADAGLAMPPKSTWFEPKLADGLVTHVLNGVDECR